MSDGTSIEWTDATANVINGCTVVSPGCANCYAMKQAHRFPVRQGLTRPSPSGMTWTGEVRFSEAALLKVLSWKRPRRIFWNAHGDIFHPSVPEEWIDRCFGAMAATPHHTHQVLTKRPERARAYLRAPWQTRIIRVLREFQKRLAGHGVMLSTTNGVLPNVWLGTSVEDQQRADERIPLLLDTPAAVRWVSAEPLLGPVDLTWIAQPNEDREGVIDALLGCDWIDGMGRGAAYRPSRPGHEGREMTRHVVSSDADIIAARKIDWVVAGGESGLSARPMHPDWVRGLRDQCAAAGVPFLFKQWGEWAPYTAIGGIGWQNATPQRRSYNGPTLGRILMPVPCGYFEQTFQTRFDDAVILTKLGKKLAGRLLDGVQHDGYPS